MLPPESGSVTGAGLKRRDLLIFGGIPLLILLFLGFTAFDQEEVSRNRQTAEVSRLRLSRLLQSIDPSLLIAQRMRVFWKSLSRRPITPERLERLTRLARKRFGFEFHPYVFDAGGTLIRPSGSQPPDASTVEEIWAIHRHTPRWKSSTYQRFKVPIRNLLGMEFAFESLESRQGQMIPFIGAGGPSMLFPINQGKFGGMIAFVHHVPPPQQFLSMALRRKFRDITLLLRSESGPWITPSGSVAPGAEALQREISNRSEGWAVASGSLWVDGRAGKLSLLAGRSIGGGGLNAARMIFLGCLLLPFAALLWNGSIADRFLARLPFATSLRPRLLLLFLYAVAVPLSGLGYLGWRTIGDSREAMITGVHRKAGELLATIDREFMAERQTALAFFRGIRDHQLARSNPKELAQYCNRLENTAKVNWIEARNLKGSIVFTTESPAITQRIGKVAEVLGRMYIEDNLAARLPLEERRLPSQVELFVRSAVENPMLGFSGIVERPDYLHTVRFGDYDLFWYWDVFRDPTHPLATLQGDLRISDVIRAYLTRRLAMRHGHEHGAFRLLAQEGADGTWYPAGSPIRNGSPLDSLAGRVRLSNRPESEVLRWRGRSWMTIGVPGGNLRGFTLLALYPVDEVERIISSRKQLIGLGMLGAILSALVFGMIFTDAFLAPIGVLGNGVLALQHRRRGVRVALDRRDELGELGTMFNAMMGDVEELLMARDIQEALIPRSPPVIPGYDLSMINITASDLGGDYLDAIVRADGKLLLVVGDVTGHGVSSSLLTAMGKAVVLQAARRNTPLPELFDRLNRLIYRQLRRKKMMTCIAGLLDPVTGTISFCNGGHLLPILARPGKPLEKIEIIHFPLGFSDAGAPFEERQVVLEPGELVCLYSDGLVEEMNAQQVPFGDERLEAALASRAAFPAQRILDEIVSDFRSHLPTPEPSDDVTLVLLKRGSG